MQLAVLNRSCTHDMIAMHLALVYSNSGVVCVSFDMRVVKVVMPARFACVVTS